MTPPILIAALREGMLRLAGREADGAIINWLSPADVRTVAGVVHDAAGGAEREIVARIFVCPSENAEVVRAAAKFAIAAYLNVPVYAEFHRWMGRSEQLQGMWDAWAAGDRKAAVAAIPDEVVDELVVHGAPDVCRKRIQEYFDNGVTTSSLAVMPLDPDVKFWDAARVAGPERRLTSRRRPAHAAGRRVRRRAIVGRRAVRGGHGSRRRGAGRDGGSPRRGGTAAARPRRRGAGRAARGWWSGWSRSCGHHERGVSHRHNSAVSRDDA